MNSLVQPEESLFDLRRFWEHCVACAIVSDRLVKRKLLPLRKTVPFNDYWIGALLHDCGKLILGFFFWDHFQEMITHMDSESVPFRQAEKATGDVANHELLGRLLLLKLKVGEQLVEAVGTHHTAGTDPSDLTCVLHVADNLAKQLGFSYQPDEPRRQPCSTRLGRMCQSGLPNSSSTARRRLVRTADRINYRPASAATAPAARSHAALRRRHCLGAHLPAAPP